MKIRDRVRELRKVPAKLLKPNPRNWRTHPKAQKDVLRGILAEIGYADALLARELADGTLELIDGHLRAETTPDAEVPVLVLDVNEEEAAKLLATLDPLAAMAEADPARLDELLKSISVQSESVAEMLSELARETGLHVPELPTAQDEVPEPLPVAVSKPGDMWVLDASGPDRKGALQQRPGPRRGHRLLCGDCTDPEQVRRVMAGERAVLFATDPPYLVGYDGTNHPNRKKDWHENRSKDWSATYGATWDDAAANPQLYEKFVTVALAEAIAPTAAWYCWHASRRQAMLEAVWEKAGAFVHQQIIWVKNRPILTRSWYMWQHEPCFMGWVKSKKPKKAGDKTLSNVWTIDTVQSAQSTEHPTSKPVEVFAIPMRQHTERGDLCYEPFSGSGSQLIAAEQLGRRCFGIEIEPRYVDVAVRRWQQMTGREAVLEGSGESWNERARAAGVGVGVGVGVGPASAGEVEPAAVPKGEEHGGGSGPRRQRRRAKSRSAPAAEKS